jgi:hypothetical protein
MSTHQITVEEIAAFLKRHEVLIASSTRDGKQLVFRDGEYHLYWTGGEGRSLVTTEPDLFHAVAAYNRMDCTK